MTLPRGAAAVLLVATTLLGGGCATIEASLPQPPGAVEPAPPPPLLLEIQAPDELEGLLRRHLDLARLPSLAAGEPIGDLELDRLVAAAPAQVRDLLETEGYFEPEVTASRAPAGDGGTPRITLRVVPGPRVRIGAVTVDVQGELDEAARGGDARAQATVRALRSNWALPRDKPFRNDDWSSAKAAVLARLRREGYLAATWSGTGAQIDVASGTARLFVVADSGPLFRTGDLLIEGIERYEEASVRHLAGFARGSPATEERLVDYQERLVLSGLFDTATVTVDTDVERASATPVTVRVKERQANEAVVGIGYSTNVGARASLNLTNRRVFDLPLMARNQFQLARLEQTWNGEISTYPGAGFWRELVGGAYSRQVSDTDVVTSWRLRAGRAQDTKPVDRLVFAEVQQSTTKSDFDPGSNLPPRLTATALTGNYNVVWRDLDDVVLPTRGVSVSLQGALGYGYSDYADNGLFTRLYGRVTGYHPLGAGFFGQARLELGDVVRRQGVAVPEPLLWRPGGENSVRGYDYRSLGPVVDGAVVSGPVLFTGSVEVGRPISQRFPSLWWAAFVDAGRSAFSWSELNPAVGAGVGLRWRSPVGPLAFDLAYGEETRAWRTHFSVGVVF